MRRSPLQARSLGGVLLAALLLAAAPAGAWPAPLTELLGRDARRLLPLTLARLLSEREEEILERSQRFPTPIVERLAADLSAGRLAPATLEALDAEASAVVQLLHSRRTHEGLVRLGSLLRVPADLADPVLSAGAAGYPPGVVGQYYALVESRLGRIPVVLEDPAALELRRADLHGYWQNVLDRSRPRSAVIRTELFRQGRVVDHRSIDDRNPVFGVASLSYSRAVTAIAATWLAIWRDAQGDLTRRPAPTRVEPRGPDAPLTGLADRAGGPAANPSTPFAVPSSQGPPGETP